VAQSVTKIISLAFLNLVTPKAGAKHELLFNKPETGLLNKGSCLARTLGMTKIINIIDIILVTLKSDLDVQHTHL
jgi:hypothetical protein